jgi:hypothetical protein
MTPSSNEHLGYPVNRHRNCHGENRLAMFVLLIGAYILGALEGYARTIPDVQNAPELDSTREHLQGAATEVCSRVFGPEWVRWVRTRFPQWDGPPAYHPTFRRELSSMCCRGASDGRCLAANDPLSFAKAGSLLAFLLEMMEPQV